MGVSRCPGSGVPVYRFTRVVMDSLGGAIRTAKCPECGARVLVMQGELVAHPERTEAPR